LHLGTYLVHSEDPSKNFFSYTSGKIKEPSVYNMDYRRDSSEAEKPVRLNDIAIVLV
jgi:hypothetical protein